MTAATNPAMAPAAERSSDPSMEEILASIRRIIADDQALPLDQRNPGHAAVVKDNSAPEPAGNQARHPETAKHPETERDVSTDVTPPGLVAVLNASSKSGTDSDFEAWLAETAAGKGIAPAPAPDKLQSPDKSQAGTIGDAVSRPPLLPRIETPAPLQSWEFAAPQAAPVVPPMPVPPMPVQPAPVQPAAAPSVLDGWGEDAADQEEARPVEASSPRLSVVENGPQDDDPGLDDDGGDLDSPVAASLDPLLLSDQTGSSVNSSFQALAQTVMLQNSGMVEQSIKEMLRPMLKQWLDDNLPTMVERLVRAEIERVARGGSG